jgi:hypothetical protein
VDISISRVLLSKIRKPLIPGIPHLPPKTIFLVGRRLASLSSPHNLIGFFFHGKGIFDIEGVFAGGKSARIKTKRIQEDKTQQILVDETGEELALVRMEVRAAFDPQENRIVGVLQSFEPFAASDDDEEAELTIS